MSRSILDRPRRCSSGGAIPRLHYSRRNYGSGNIHGTAPQVDHSVTGVNADKRAIRRMPSSPVRAGIAGRPRHMDLADIAHVDVMHALLVVHRHLAVVRRVADEIRATCRKHDLIGGTKRTVAAERRPGITAKGRFLARLA